MAIGYTNLFTMLGSIVKAVNRVNAYYAELDTDVAAVETAFGTNSQYALLSDAPSTWDGFKSSVLGWINQISSRGTRLLTDRDLVLEQLPIGSGTSIQKVIPLLTADMIAETETIEKSTVTLGSVTTVSTNATVGTLLVDAHLDGYTSPGNRFPAMESYDGVLSELAEDDTVVLKCITDSEGEATEGQESFQWLGMPTKPSPYHWQDPGTGTGPQIRPLNAETYIANGEFETFSTNTPGSWTIDNGTAGTHIYQEASVTYRGDYALKLTGDGAQATIGISQVPSGTLYPLKRYCVAVWVRGTAATLAGTLTIQFEGTGYTAGGTEKISLDATALSALTGYTLKWFYVNLPREIPDDLELVVKVTGTLTTAKSVYLDGLVMGPVNYIAGINAVIVAGTDKFLKGDTFTFTIANNDGGVFQTWFRKYLGYQLPSDATPSISDTLAT